MVVTTHVITQGLAANAPVQVAHHGRVTSRLCATYENDPARPCINYRDARKIGGGRSFCIMRVRPATGGMRSTSIVLLAAFTAGCVTQASDGPPLRLRDQQRAVALDWVFRHAADLQSTTTFCVTVHGQYLTDPAEQPSAALLTPYQSAQAGVVPSARCRPAEARPGVLTEVPRDTVWVSVGGVLDVTDSTAVVDAGLWTGPLAAESYRCRIVRRGGQWYPVECYLAGVS
jgi:hypothetical protein